MSEDWRKYVDTKINNEMKEFVKHEIFGPGEFLFYENVDNYQEVYCSYCGKKYISTGYKHNETEECQCCNNTFKVKNARRGKKILKKEVCLYWFEESKKSEDTIICKGYYCNKDYDRDYINPKIEYELNAVYIFEYGKKAKMYKKSYYWGFAETSSVYGFNINWLARFMCHTSEESLYRAVENTKFKYMKDIIEENRNSRLVSVLGELSENTWLEQLYKAGFQKITEERVRYHTSGRALNKKGENIYKILKLDRKRVREIQKYGAHKVNSDSLYVFQKEIKKNQKANIKDIVKIVKDMNYREVIGIHKYMSLMKADRYLKKQVIETGESYYEASITYNDYLENCVKLDMNMKDESVLYPKNIKKSHDNVLKQVKVKGDIRLDRKIEKRIKKINEKYYFKYSDFHIRAAESTEELIKESKVLGHCVAANYTGLYANGKTNILFIRKNSDPSIPYFTVEISNNGRIVQVRTKKNKTPKELNLIDVIEFVDAFEKEKLKSKDSKVA